MKAMLKVRALTVATAIAGVACATSSTPRASAPERTPQVNSQAPNSPTTVNESTPGTIPAGQEIDVRLRNTLSSETATVEQRFETTTVVDLVQNGRVLVPAGSVVQGVVSDVDKAGRIDRDGALTLTFDRMNVNDAAGLNMPVPPWLFRQTRARKRFQGIELDAVALADPRRFEATIAHVGPNGLDVET